MSGSAKQKIPGTWRSSWSNGRWARIGAWPYRGHRAGIERVKEIVRAAAELGKRVVTFLAFSTVNGSWPMREIKRVMRYLVDFLGRQNKNS
jgi:undecaprenyl diphosphate synthase